MKQPIPARVLAFERAATMVGGVSELARRLNVAERQLDYWMRDIGSPPDTMFFDVMNIIIENAGDRAACNENGDELRHAGPKSRLARVCIALSGSNGATTAPRAQKAPGSP